MNGVDLRDFHVAKLVKSFGFPSKVAKLVKSFGFPSKTVRPKVLTTSTTA